VDLHIYGTAGTFGTMGTGRPACSGRCSGVIVPPVATGGYESFALRAMDDEGGRGW
jgi:hypothetical protein